MEVLEWADEDGIPLEVWFTPLTGHDIEALNKRQDKNSSDAEYLIDIMILKAMDDEGKPLFAFGDKEALLSSAHYATVYRIAQAIQTRFTLPIENVEAAKKKLPESQSSTSNSGLEITTDGALNT